MEELPVKQTPKQLLPYIWKKGQSGNPNGRPKGKTLKEFAREYLESLPDDEKVDYLASLPTEIVWKMAEGNPKNDIEHSGTLNIGQVLDDIEHGSTTEGQTVENEQPIQDQEQTKEPDNVQEEQSSSTLQPKKVVEKYNP